MIEPRDLEIAATDGFALSARVFDGEPSSRGSILVNPATGVRQGYYEPFARYLAGRGWRVVTFDNRGVGGSRPRRLRGFEARMQDWAELDSEGVLRWLLGEDSGAPVHVVGHSFGGQALGLMPSSGALVSAALVAPQSGYWGHWPWRQRPRAVMLWYLLIPLVTAVLGYFPARRFGLGEDLPAGVARQWARWGRHSDYLLRDGRPEWRERYRSLGLPILCLGIADDPLAPPAAVAAILSLYAGAEIDHRQAEPSSYGFETIGHFGFFRERCRGALWDTVGDWLESHRGGGLDGARFRVR